MASGRTTPKRGKPDESGFTSREASRISGVPFFTVDYWDRSAFLKPSIARSTGRGRGHGRLYSYADVLRLCLARELRDEHVSLQTLRYVVRRLGEMAEDLVAARYVVVGRKLRLATSFDELVGILRGDRRTFGIVLDLEEIHHAVAARVRRFRPSAATPPTDRRTGS